jgi:hypothetical protein
MGGEGEVVEASEVAAVGRLLCRDGDGCWITIGGREVCRCELGEEGEGDFSNAVVARVRGGDGAVEEGCELAEAFITPSIQ